MIHPTRYSTPPTKSAGRPIRTPQRIAAKPGQRRVIVLARTSPRALAGIGCAEGEEYSSFTGSCYPAGQAPTVVLHTQGWTPDRAEEDTAAFTHAGTAEPESWLVTQQRMREAIATPATVIQNLPAAIRTDAVSSGAAIANSARSVTITNQQYNQAAAEEYAYTFQNWIDNGGRRWVNGAWIKTDEPPPPPIAKETNFDNVLTRIASGQVDQTPIPYYMGNPMAGQIFDYSAPLDYSRAGVTLTAPITRNADGTITRGAPVGTSTAPMPLLSSTPAGTSYTDHLFARQVVQGKLPTTAETIAANIVAAATNPLHNPFIHPAATPTAPPEQCPKDARTCPDGTVQGRTGPNCTFPPCPPYTPALPPPPTNTSGTYTAAQLEQMEQQRIAAEKLRQAGVTQAEIEALAMAGKDLTKDPRIVSTGPLAQLQNPTGSLLPDDVAEKLPDWLAALPIWQTGLAAAALVYAVTQTQLLKKGRAR